MIEHIACIHFSIKISKLQICCKIGVRASDKKTDVDIGDKARSIKTKFENGEVYEEKHSHSQQQIDDSAVFELGE